MKNIPKRYGLTLLMLVLVLVGCAEANQEAYNEAINSGLEELRIEQYEEAEASFETALNEKPEDERAAILLKQTQGYREALQLLEDEQFAEATEKAEWVQSVEEGSSYLVFKAGELLDTIQTVQKQPEESVVAEEEDISSEIIFEDFKGAYATFARGHYEWPVDYLFIIGDDFVIDGYGQTGLAVHETLSKLVEGNILHLRTFVAEGLRAGEDAFELELSYDDQQVPQLILDSGEILYPITVEDAFETGFGYINEMTDMLNEVRAYDNDVPKALNYTNTEVLTDYTAAEVEYVRVWLNIVGNEGISELNVNEFKAGEVINFFDENSPVYPEDVIYLTGVATADGHVTYSSNGDGTINRYLVPGHWHTPDEDLPELYEEILNPERIYIDPLEDKEILKIIQKVNER